MIAHLSGILFSKTASMVIIMTGGVGYELSIPLSTYYSLPEKGDEVELSVSTILRDDSIQLFGFLSPTEKKTFMLLRTVSKIGPKLALNILSGINPGELVQAVNEKNVARLNSVSGVGAKTAERIILDLKDKLADLVPESELSSRPLDKSDLDPLNSDAVSGLTNLGYDENESKKAVQEAIDDLGPEAEISDIIRKALRGLRKT
jgi:Holliday junction DNA helicase RuvA